MAGCDHSALHGQDLFLFLFFVFLRNSLMVSQSIIGAVVQKDEAPGKVLVYCLVVLQFLECNRAVLEAEAAEICCHLIDHHEWGVRGC